MGCTECIVDVNIRERCKLLRKRRVIFYFFGIKPDVLKQQHFAVLHRRNRTLGSGADAVADMCDAHTQFLAEGYGDRCRGKPLPVGSLAYFGSARGVLQAQFLRFG